ncbi:helix-turn-helix transcriptional regulator [Streptomyces griseoviridis]|uniref:Helix-turn-helix transcriptional regulator n=2 Tax=Streptomyces TaxID=1883 RepID=A0A3Q9KRK5_STRGD|nr:MULTISPECIES: helix-turn-helix transcriptional regulator [Streptomyces]AZS82906.1 LuxR family transcriptional regulator [Streptomyces griseoviridis]MDH6695594.1 DNA-binding CsgD family transcriptional regulator/sugar-specific transcriptional regulator TrmB [Streptomyces sp. MAA16]MDT0470765.1 helix-turn-helix transcriptional regulator [Streptomyces sp. DSM 41014]QCN90244.1 helix-turn-helix transcriptional regulator [Streptomyces griseoviridis]
MLDVLGMDATAEVVYREMLAHPDDGVADLTRRLQLDRQAVRTALDTLGELALVWHSPEDPQSFHVVDPHLAAEMLLARQRAELAAQQQRLQEAQAAAVQLKAEFTQESGRDEMHRLTGVDCVRDYLAALYDKVESELLTFAPGGAQTEANLRSSRPLAENLLERGVQMRTVYVDSVRNDSATVTHAEWLTARGGRIRTVPSLPNRMILCDRKIAIVAVDSDDTSAGAVVLHTPGVVSSLCALFESVWQSAQPIGATAQPCDEQQLSLQQMEVLRLLSLGHTDDYVAARLGVSARTARRIATKLMEYLGARSRFQTGVHAAARGLIRP